MRSLPVPTSINIFKLEPLRGNALLVVDTRLVFSLVENFFGGVGTHPKIEGRDFTPIEQSVIAKVVKIILSNLEDAWRPVHEIAVELLRSEINPQFATIVPPSDVVVVISFEVELENAMGTMVLALPYATIEPIRAKLYAAFQTERLEIDQVWVSRFRDRLMETPVDMDITLGTTRLTGRQLLNLKVGDVVLLDQDEDDLLTARVQGILKFQGEPGLVKGNKAFKVIREQELNY